MSSFNTSTSMDDLFANAKASQLDSTPQEGSTSLLDGKFLVVAGAAVTIALVGTSIHNASVYQQKLRASLNLWESTKIHRPSFALVNFPANVAERFFSALGSIRADAHFFSTKVRLVSSSLGGSSESKSVSSYIATAREEVMEAFEHIRGPCMVYHSVVLIDGEERDLFRTVQEIFAAGAGKSTMSLHHIVAWTIDGSLVSVESRDYHGVVTSSFPPNAHSDKIEDLFQPNEDTMDEVFGKEHWESHVDLKATEWYKVNDAIFGPTELFMDIAARLRFSGKDLVQQKSHRKNETVSKSQLPTWVPDFIATFSSKLAAVVSRAYHKIPSPGVSTVDVAPAEQSCSLVATQRMGSTHEELGHDVSLGNVLAHLHQLRARGVVASRGHETTAHLSIECEFSKENMSQIRFAPSTKADAADVRKFSSLGHFRVHNGNEFVASSVTCIEEIAAMRAVSEVARVRYVLWSVAL